MKKNYLLYLLFVIATGFVSCGKDFHSDDSTADSNTIIVYTTAAEAAADNAAIQSYFTANNITTAKKDTSGLYYQILTPGTGVVPNASNTVKVTYVGTLLDGTVFDNEPNPISLKLSTLIIGWQVGLPYISAGGSIILYIPSGLAYGVNSPSTLVPANSVLIYNINLLSVQ